MRIGSFGGMYVNGSDSGRSDVASPDRAKSVFTDGSHSGGCRIYASNEEICQARREAWRANQTLENDPFYIIPAAMYRLMKTVCFGVGRGVQSVWRSFARAEAEQAVTEAQKMGPPAEYRLVREALEMTIGHSEVLSTSISSASIVRNQLRSAALMHRFPFATAVRPRGIMAL